MADLWKDRAFGDLPIGAEFWHQGVKFVKTGSFEAAEVEDLHEFSWEDDVEILILG